MQKSQSSTELKKIGHPVFLFAVTLLIVNDWYLKPVFGNELTGKLSDFAGLFAFPYLISVFFPYRKKLMHISTVILFVFWKSSAAQPMIDLISDFGMPIYRVVDYTDLVALISVWFSYVLVRQNLTLFQTRFVLHGVVLISVLAFVATSMPSRKRVKYTLSKVYDFELSKRELVSRLNAVQLKELRMLSKISGGSVDFDSETNVFHYHNRTDTLGLILDYSKIKDQDTIVYKTSYAEIMITGDEVKSTLKLVAVHWSIRPWTVESKEADEKKFKERALRAFERHVVKKIRKMPD